MPKLQISLPDGAELSHDLEQDLITVGRVEDNVLQIDDISVSSHHGQLELKGDDYVLTDLGSTNGTRLNGKSIAANEEHKLQDGDQILFGKIDAVYSSDTPASTRPLPVEDEPTVRAAESSVRPADFANASPFQSKKKKKDPTGMAVMALGIVAILAFGAAVAVIMGMQPPA